MWRSNLRNFRDAYLVTKGTTTAHKRRNESRNINTYNRKPVSQNTCYILHIILPKIKITLIGIVKVAYQLIEWNEQIYSKTSGSIWNYCIDKTSDPISDSELFFQFYLSF